MAERILMQIFFACLLATAAATTPSAPVLSPSQVQYLADARAAATKASQEAETELLRAFRAPSFRLGLLWHGGWKLASTPATELLAQLKSSLNAVEYTSNFGVDPAWRKTHPGEPSMGFETIVEYGYIPSMWQLRAANSPLVNGTPPAQWALMEAAERGLYQLPLTSKPLPIGPNVKESLERPQYLGVNTRKVTMGIYRYGAFSAVVRNDVVRERGVFVGADSGGWENSCNSSLTPMSKWYPILGRIMGRCGGMYNGGDAGKQKTVVGTAGNQLHTILGNTEIFGKLGGHLSRLVYQMLSPAATHRPLEELFYPEAGLLGPLRPRDMKMIVASFPTIFGSRDAITVRLFCLAHRIPLVWALNDGETWAQEFQGKLKFLPFAPVAWHVDDRLLDPLSWFVTNASSPRPSHAEWEKVFDEVETMRNNTDGGNSGSAPPEASHFKAWWNRLAVLGGPVHPLRGGECASTDLCFGTYTTQAGTKDCICKKLNATNAEAAATLASGAPRDVGTMTQPDVSVVVV